MRAQEEIESYLSGKYDTAREFTDTSPFSRLTAYKASARGELNFAAYDPTIEYLAADKANVIYLGKAYTINVNTPNPAGTFDPGSWILLGNQYEIVSLALPYTEFNYYGNYNVGDVVWYKDKVYKCLQPSGQITHTTYLNSITKNNIPPTNVFPDDITAGLSVWGVGVDYSVTGAIPGATYAAYVVQSYSIGQRVSYNGENWESLKNTNTATPGTDITAWQPFEWEYKDNRSARLVEVMVDIALMKLHQRIAPRNIPELRAKNYASAMEWLTNSNHGDITPKLKLIQPLQGNRISYGGNTKTTNIY